MLKMVAKVLDKWSLGKPLNRGPYLTLQFLLEVKQVITMDEITPEPIINFDQTGLNVVLVSDRTMEAAGAKRVEMVGQGEETAYCSFGRVTHW